MSDLYIRHLSHIYGPERAAGVAPALEALVSRHKSQIVSPADIDLTGRDALLITYPDQLRRPGEPPLRTLSKFCHRHLSGLVSGVHILPFFPWSSDDGFAVMDHRAVDPDYGSWLEIEELGRFFRLMFDGVINHASARGVWFQSFLQDEAPYRDYFLTVKGDPDLSGVVRPRSLPLLTEYSSTSGPRRVWTTFSADQPDLDFHNPQVLLEIVDVLLGYVEHGAQFLRLDAIAYLWKEIGTSCIHLPQTHATVKLLRAVLGEAAPHVRLVTETNVAHAENISYFGNGTDESQMVYNFSLPPLVLHTFRVGDATVLSEWAAGLEPPSGQTAFFNFLASHDGIGLNPVRGILAPSAIQSLVDQTLHHGGQVSYKQDMGGTQIPYELNINYFDALSDPHGEENIATRVDRFMAAQAIMLCLRGVPGIYFHSLFGSQNWPEGVEQTGSKRAINRQKLSAEELERDLSDPGSLRSLVFNRYQSLLTRRSKSAAFHPNANQDVLPIGREVFAVLRTSPDGATRCLCLHNVTDSEQTVHALGEDYHLSPYQVMWVDGT